MGSISTLIYTSELILCSAIGNMRDPGNEVGLEHSIQAGDELLHKLHAKKNGDRRRPDEPLGSYSDLPIQGRN